MIALLLGVAWGSGYYYSDSGIVGTGRGGAIIAGTDDQFAQHHNPAGLIRIEHPRLNIGMSLVHQNATFARMVHAASGDYLEEPVKNEASPFSVPQVGFATPLIRDKLAFAFGFYSPFAPSYTYPDDGPQRYTMIDALIYQGAGGPSLAYRPIKQLTVGVGLQWQFIYVSEDLYVTTSGPNGQIGGEDEGEDYPLGDVRVTATVKQIFLPNFNIGVLVEPVEQLSIGFSVQPPSNFKGKGHGVLDFSGHQLADDLDQKVWTDDDISLAISLPWVFATGVAVRPIPALEVEAAFVYQRWSALQDLLVSEIDVTVTGSLFDGAIPIADEVSDSIGLPAGFRDAVSYRLGAEYDVIPEFTARVGGFYETGALPPENVSVAVLDTNKVQIGGGTTTRLLSERLILDASFAYLFFPDLEMRTSDVTQINVYGGVEGVVGDGDYTSNGFILGAQASWVFKKKDE